MDGAIASPDRTRAGATLLAAALLLCAPRLLAAPATGEAAALRLVGSRAMSGPVQAWTRLFHQLYPDRPVHAAMFGSGLGAGAMADANADIVPLARPLRSGERRLLDPRPAPVMVPVGVARPGDADVFLYLARDPQGRPRAEAIAFARVALSREGQAGLAASGYAPLPDEARAAALTRLAQLAATST